MTGLVGLFGRKTVAPVGRIGLLLLVMTIAGAADARTLTTASGAAAASAAVAVADAASNPHGRAATAHTARIERDGGGALSMQPFPAASTALMGDRGEDVALLAAMALEPTPFGDGRFPNAPAAHDVRAAATHASYGLPLPEPDGWTAVAATIALALFFFLRRLS